MRSSQFNRPPSRRANLEKLALRETKFNDPMSRNVHRPVPILSRVELKKPDFTKKHETNKTNAVLDRPKARFNEAGRFNEQAVNVRRIPVTIKQPQLEDDQGDLSSDSSALIIGRRSDSSCNSALEASFGHSGSVNFSSSSGSNDDLSSAFVKVNYVTPGDIAKGTQAFKYSVLEPISSGNSVDFTLSGMDSDVRAACSKLIEGTSSIKLDISEATIQAFSEGEVNHTDLESLCYKVVDSDDEDYDSCDEKKSNSSRSGRKSKASIRSSSRSISRGERPYSVGSMKSNVSESSRISYISKSSRISKDGDSNLTPDESNEMCGVSTPKERTREEEYEEKVQYLHEVSEKLKEHQKVVIGLRAEVGDLFYEMNPLTKPGPLENLVLIGSEQDNDFVLARRYAQSEAGSEQAEDAPESTTRVSQAEAERDAFFADFSGRLERNTENTMERVDIIRKRNRDVVNWLGCVVHRDFNLNDEAGRNTVIALCADSQKVKEDCDLLDSGLSEFSAYTLMTVSSLLERIEQLKKEKLEISTKLKKAVKECRKLGKLMVKVFRRKDELTQNKNETDNKLAEMHDVGCEREQTIIELQKKMGELDDGYGKINITSSKLRDEVMALNKKISFKETDTRKKLNDHRKIIDESEGKIAFLREDAAILHETFAETLQTRKARELELNTTIDKLREDISELNEKLISEEQIRLSLEKELEENTLYVTKAEAAMTKLIYKTDPKYRQPYPLRDAAPTDREKVMWTELQRTKGLLKRVKEEAKRRQHVEDAKRLTMGGPDEEMAKLRRKLAEKDEEAEEMSKTKEELQRKMEEQSEAMRKLQLAVEEVKDGAQLALVLIERNDILRCIELLTAAHRDILRQAELSEAALSAKMFEIVQRDHYMMQECRATAARDKLISVINERRMSQGDGMEVERIVDTDSRFNAYHKMIQGMIMQKKETERRLEEIDKKDERIRELEDQLNGADQHRVILEQCVADLEFKLRECEMDQID